MRILCKAKDLHILSIKNTVNILLNARQAFFHNSTFTVEGDGRLLEATLYGIIQELISIETFEPHREKTGFLPMRKQRRRSAAVTAKLISAFVFATRIVQSLFYLYPKFQASSSFL